MARLLISAGNGKPTQACLRRAVSATYYALFHVVARNCADTMIGAAKNGRSKYAWAEVYRSLAHGSAKAACEDKNVISKFPSKIVNFSTAFVDLQGRRHSVDYNPYSKLYKSAVSTDVDIAENAIIDFRSVALI